jgi:cytochrome c oxidase cbb3-type subunit 3
MRWERIILSLLVLCTISCKRETRNFKEPNQGRDRINAVPLTDLSPGKKLEAPRIQNDYEDNAYAVSEGKRLFDWYNCSGCHAHGGGGSGPALMDDRWIYGGESAQIYRTIVEGRPNGMPSFRGKIPENQLWQIVAFVRSLNGKVTKDVASGRDDHMHTKQDEASFKDPGQEQSFPPPSGVMPK